MAVRNCPNCGAAVVAGAIFCDDCGVDLRTAIPVAPSDAPADSGIGSASAGSVCPACQHHNRAGAAYCENCGTRLLSTPASPIASAPVAKSLPVYQPPIPAAPILAARLALPASNMTFPLPEDQTEIIIGREDAISGAFPQVNLEPYGAQDAGVSRRHARVRVLTGDWWIEDLNSVNGTFLNRQRLNPDQPMPLNHGDEVRLGKLALIFYRD